MKTGHLVATLAAAAGLFGAGAYLARASSSTPVVAAAPAPAAIPAPRRAPPALHRPAPAPGLAQDLHDADPKVRRAATAELARDPSDAPALLAASRDRDLEVSIVATVALGKLYASGELPASELVARIQDRDLPEKVRASALNGLGMVPAPDTAKLFAELVASGDTLDRRSAAVLLANQDPALAVPALIDALSDPDEYVRGNAVEALRRLGRGRDYGTDANAWRSWWQSRIVTP
jgi:HEAT repeat protein